MLLHFLQCSVPVLRKEASIVCLGFGRSFAHLSRGGGRASKSALIMRAVALIVVHSSEVIMVPSEWRTACSIGGLDTFPCDVLTSGSFLQSSKFQRISNG